MQVGWAPLIIFVYSMYGAYIASLFILFNDKGGLRSSDFLLFIVVFVFFLFTNLGNIFFNRTLNSRYNITLVLFLSYFLLRVATNDSVLQSDYFIQFFSEIGTNFVAGFIAFSLIEFRASFKSMPILMRLNRGSAASMAIFGTVFFVVLNIYFLSEFFGASLSDIFKIRYLSNDYYQEFGDFFTIAYSCLVFVQMDYFKRRHNTSLAFFAFVLTFIVQMILAFFCLQAVNSNKSVLVIVLTSILAIYFCKPKEWLLGRWKIKRQAFYLVPLMMILALLLFRFASAFNISQLRAFDYGESDSILGNSSIQTRLQQVKQNGMEQILSAPLFGDLSIRSYMHSSLLSTQTHLGLIGTILFWSFVFFRCRRIYTNDGQEGLKSIALPILFVSSISSFFTWGPLWFLIGALYGCHDQPTRKSFRFQRAEETSSLSGVCPATGDIK